MGAFLPAWMFGFFVFFWNVETYLKEHGRLPGWRDYFKIHIRDVDRRAFSFFVFLFVVFFCYFVYSVVVAEKDQILIWLASNVDTIVKALLYGSVVINYLVRASVLAELDKLHAPVGDRFVWDAWGVKERDCKSKRSVILLRCVNACSFVFLVLLVGVEVFAQVGDQ